MVQEGRSPAAGSRRRRWPRRAAFWLRLGQQGDDPADVGDEAHVEHPVGLVEDEDLDLAEVDRAAGPTWSRSRPGVATRISMPAAELLDLGVDRHAAVDARPSAAAHSCRRSRRSPRPASPARGSASGRATRTGWRAGEKLVFAWDLEALEDRQDEGGRLAGARSGRPRARRGPRVPGGWPGPGRASARCSPPRPQP